MTKRWSSTKSGDGKTKRQAAKDARRKAEREVFRVRGSYDAPGFEACVKAEMQRQK